MLKVLVGKCAKRNSLVGVDVDGSIILKQILKNRVRG
jgi:hypothetical protein